MIFMHKKRRLLSFISLLVFVFGMGASSASAYYNPKTGRFISPDPNGQGLVVSPGLAYYARNPTVTVNMAYELQYGDGMNFYDYLRSNPHKYVDPSGLLPDWIGNFMFWATGGADTAWGRFLESDTSQDVADVAGLVGGTILLFTPGAGAGAAALASRIGNFPRLQAFGNAVLGLAHRFRGIHTVTKGVTRAGFAGGLVLGFYDGINNRRTGSIGFISASATGSAGIAAVLSNLIFSPSVGRQIAVGFGGLGGLFVGTMLGRVGGRLTDEIIDAIYEGNY